MAVIPAKAGIHLDSAVIPAKAGIHFRQDDDTRAAPCWARKDSVLLPWFILVFGIYSVYSNPPVWFW